MENAATNTNVPHVFNSRKNAAAHRVFFLTFFYPFLKNRCSLECYKKHQQTEQCHQPGTNVSNENVFAIEPDEDADESRLQMFTTDDTVAQADLAKLGKSLKKT